MTGNRINPVEVPIAITGVREGVGLNDTEREMEADLDTDRVRLPVQVLVTLEDAESD